MTARQIYDYVLIEMNKVNAPSLLLEDFNYLFNKAINLYINKKYNNYDVNLQSTDDLRVLKSTATLIPHKTDKYGQLSYVGKKDGLFGATYEVNLPDDYLHVLNCICSYKVHKLIKCYDKGTNVFFGAYRLTSDMWSQVITNQYMRPSYKRPYYFIHNVNVQSDIPTNPYTLQGGTDAHIVNSVYTDYVKFIEGKDRSYEQVAVVTVENSNFVTKITSAPVIKEGNLNYGILLINDKTFDLIPLEECSISNIKYYVSSLLKVENGELVIKNIPDLTLKVVDSEVILNLQQYAIQNFPRTTTIEGHTIDLVEKPAELRYGNASRVRMEIRYGQDNSIFELETVYVDYVKTPLFIRLTPEQIESTEDFSQAMEFPDYVCQEIINELTHLLMENASDQRLPNHVAVSLSIGLPAQQLTQS